MLKIIGLGLTSLCLSYCGVFIIRRWAEWRQLVDVPNARSSHTMPTARGGGLAIVLVVLAGWSVYDWLSYDIWPILPYVVGAALIAYISWLDDLCDAPTIVRLAIHGSAAALAILSFGYWHITSIPQLLELKIGWLGLALTFLWIVGLTNAYNFMDGIDGIAGSQAVVAGFSWAVLGWLAGQPHVSAMGMLLTGASLGFLLHNWPPARIFMGDVGSAFLGYTFAVLPLMSAHAPKADSRLAYVGALLLWPFIFDSAFTFLRRAWRGENVFSAHRSHLYQRLVIAGHTHLSVTLLYTGLAVVGAALAAIWLKRISGRYIALATVMPILAVWLLLYVMHSERKVAAGKVSGEVAMSS